MTVIRIVMRLPAAPGERWTDDAIRAQIGKTVKVNIGDRQIPGVVIGGYRDDNGSMRLSIEIENYEPDAVFPQNHPPQ